MTKIKCVCCDGVGWVYYGKRDPIEGNKMRPSDTCPMCEGEKSFEPGSPEGLAHKIFDVTLSKECHRQRAEAQRQQEHVKAVRKAALQKLTAEERKVLGLTNDNA